MRVLYLSYDGMTDTLGQSQVIPYLTGLRNLGHEIDILSFEKPQAFTEKNLFIEQLLKERGIGWFPQIYHKKPPILSTVYDLYCMKTEAAKLHQKQAYDWIHARSYISGLAALSMKRAFGVKFLFDMRGFWADERVDGGIWKLNNPLFYLVYKFFKFQERAMLEESDQVVCLTHRAQEIMKTNWGLPQISDKISVIPCCVDYQHFSQSDSSLSADLKKKIQWNVSEKYLVYLGSLGTWYMLEEMLRFFSFLRAEDSSFKFLIFTPDNPSLAFSSAAKYKLESHIRVMRLDRKEVPQALRLCHLAISFILPSFSKLSSSPTKVGEYLATGLPVVANGGVGDMEALFQNPEVGVIIDSFHDTSLHIAAKTALTKLGPSETRKNVARTSFSLENGINSYQEIYSHNRRAKPWPL